MRSRPTSGLARVMAGILVGVCALLLSTPTATAGEQLYFWKWSDGVDAKERTLGQGQYRSAERLPQLIVRAIPATPRHRVALEYLDGREWRREDVAVTAPSGRATLELNPYCEDGDWCDESVAYRLVVDGVKTAFTLTYAR